jgi:hypothetical protein
MPKKTSIIIVTLVVVSIMLSVVLAAVLSYRTVNNTVTIVSGGADFGVFSDASCTQPLTSLDWGQLIDGQWQTQTFYLLNNGTGNTIYVWWEAPDSTMGLNVELSNPVSTPFPSPDPLPSPSTSPYPMNGFWYPTSMYKIALYSGQPVQVQAWLTSYGLSGTYSWTLAFTGEDS